MKKNKTSATTDAEIVAQFMQVLHHPLKAEIEAVRQIILGANPEIKERIKWNAPSYYTTEDLVTFNPRTPKFVHLVFHHKEIVNITSPLLQGNYKDRRMMYLHTMQEVKENKKELQKIMNDLLNKINNSTNN